MTQRVRIAAASALALATAGLAACATTPVAPVNTAPVELQILALNDFHGNLETQGSQTRYIDDAGVEQRETLGGAARMASLLQTLREGEDLTVTVAAGDLVGASPLASSYFLDEPAIAALNRMGLEIASVGNHEFDRGTAELRRLQDGGCEANTPRQPCAIEPFAGAEFTYLAGNVVNEAGDTLFPASTIRDFGTISVGFVGLTLKDTGKLASPGGTAGWSFTDEAAAANAEASRLRAAGADEVVLLIHQGGDVDPFFSTGGCPSLGGAIMPILDALDPDIRLVVSGHTHKAYVCELQTEAGPSRLLTSAGRYGGFVTDIAAGIDPVTRRFTNLAARNVPVGPDSGEEPETAALVARYVDASRPIADRQIGTLTGRAPEGDCVESWNQSLVADAQLAATRGAEQGGAQIALMNSGGVRTQLEPGAVTFGQLFAMQPFGNTLSVLELTGEQLRRVLEQQFCEGKAGSCYSSLTPSAGFAYAFDGARPVGQRITSMALNGEAIDPAGVYRVTANNFIASGGDGFTVLAEGRPVGDGGMDVAALENYFGGGDVTIPACGRIADMTGAATGQTPEI